MLEREAELGRADLHLVDRVVAELLAAEGVDGENILLVGAQCRDVWHRALGHSSPVLGTNDIDLGIAVRGTMSDFAALVAPLPRSGDTGIRFEVAEVLVDLMPFGAAVEEPPGTVTPPGRQLDPFSVFGFEDVLAHALPLRLPSGALIRLATPGGLTALKVAAWHDRSQWFDDKDGADLALIVSWYLDSQLIERWLWTEDPPSVLPRFEYDAGAGAAYLAGRCARASMSAELAPALADLWRASRSGVLRPALLSGWLGGDPTRVGGLVRAFGAGIEGDTDR